MIWDISARMTQDATTPVDNSSARTGQDATMNRDRISATTTYVMWCEERLWNVGVLQGVRLSNLVLSSV
jgi:hypothetical protein